MIPPPPAVAPRLGETVAEARKLVHLGLASARGLSKSSWFVAGVLLAAAGLAIAVLLKERDPVLLKLEQTPPDDEPVTPEERAAINAARAEESIPWEEAKVVLGKPTSSEGRTTR
jgi:hypothetical protein